MTTFPKLDTKLVDTCILQRYAYQGEQSQSCCMYGHGHQLTNTDSKLFSTETEAQSSSNRNPFDGP